MSQMGLQQLSPSGRVGRRMVRTGAAARLGLLLFGLRFALCFQAGLCAQLGPVSSPASVAQRAPALASRFGHVPLFFEANRGQADAAVLFVAHGRDHQVYLTQAGAWIALAQGAEAGGLGPGPQRASSATLERAIHLTFPGANAQPLVAGLEPAAAKVNYLVGRNPAGWQQGVETFARVRYAEIYPGIDLIYHGNERQLEFDFEIAAGTAPADIVLRFEGADRLEIDAHGDLVLHLGRDQLRHHRPVAFQKVGAERREVPVRYRIHDDGTVRFEVGHYDIRRALTIDPVLSYSTYVGGSKGDIGWAITVDPAGCAYIAGDTRSLFKTLPTSGYQPAPAGGTKYGGDAFVAKLDPTGTNLLFLTYLGGSGIDGAVGIALDSAGCLFLTGYTDSTDFPTAGLPTVLQPAIAGTNDPVFKVHAPDAFVTKLDASGSKLVYSTYLGGEGNDSGAAIAVDAAGAAYVVGTTESAIVYQTSNQVCTLRCTNTFGFTNMLGETNLYLCGAPKCTTNVGMTRVFFPVVVVTNLIRQREFETITEVVTTTLLDVQQISAGFPTVNAPQTNNHGPANFFVSKLSANGDALLYATYLGGSGRDQSTGIAVDSGGRAMVCGSASSVDFPVTNAIQGFSGGLVDAVVAKLDAAGGSIIYSTYLGGTRNDLAYRVATDAAGAAYVVGAEGSSDFPSTPGALNRGGVFQSTDVGGSWNLRSAGITHTIVQALLADPANPAALYAGTPRGVFKTVDGGATWIGLSTGLVNRAVATLAYDASNAVLYAGTQGGLFSSTDGGLLWTNDGPGITATSIRALLFETNGVIDVGTSGGVFKRDVGATNYVAFNAGLKNRSVNALVQSPADLSLLYAATDGGVFKSTNSAVNWKASSSGMKNKHSLALALDPSAPETLYVGTSKGVFKSTDAATNWVESTNGLGRPTVNALLVDPVTPSTVYAGTLAGLFKSVDAGATWTASDTNLDTRQVMALTFASGSTTTLYSGTKGTNFAGGTNDAFLVKVAPDGSALSYGFTLGGNKDDQGWDVAVDALGCAVLTGSTASKNFPVAGASFPSQTNLVGHTDVFVTKVDAAGSSNIFSIYLGGKGNDYPHGVALDSGGAIYVVGHTASSHFVVTNAIQPKFSSGSSDAFVLKLLPAPGLTLARAGRNLLLRWTPFPTPYVLESCDPLDGRWTRVPQPAVLQDGQETVLLPAADACRIFRLREAP